MKNFMEMYHKIPLWAKIIVGIILGVILGFSAPAAATAITPVGTIFLNLLKMLIVPLALTTLISGICKMGDTKQLRTVGGRIVLYYLLTSTLAAILGTVFALITQPGSGVTELLTEEAGDVAQYNFIDNIVSWVPTNIVQASADANMLQIIVFAIFFGVVLLALGEKVAPLVHGIDLFADAMLKMTEYVIALAPYGILALVANMVSTMSAAMMKQAVVFILTDIAACLTMIVLVYPLLLKLLSKLHVLTFMKKIVPCMLVAVSTTSSAATLPVSLKVAKEDLGISEKVCGFTLPLGNTCNMDGAAIGYACIAVFACNLYGYEINAAMIFQIIFLGLIISIGSAGVKGAGIVMSTVLLESLGMPLTLIPILSAIWCLIDPGHTTCNNVGDLVGTGIVAAKMNLVGNKELID